MRENAFENPGAVNDPAFMKTHLLSGILISPVW
jgi:hypothetical protein